MRRGSGSGGGAIEWWIAGLICCVISGVGDGWNAIRGGYMESDDRIDRMREILAEWLHKQLGNLGRATTSQTENLRKVRQLCALANSPGIPVSARRELIVELRRNPIVLPIPGGFAEFCFRFPRDLWTIASGGWEPQNLRLLECSLRPGNVVIDAGAHVGHLTIFSAHMVGRGGRVIAIEPAPVNFAALVGNIKRSGMDGYVTAVQAALSDSGGIARVFDDGDTGGTEYSLFPVRHGNRGIAFEARMITLDALIEELQLKEVHFIKLDTEGAELAILRGAGKTLRRDEVAILIELHPWVVSPEEVCAVLLRAGFRLYYVSDRMIPIPRCDDLRRVPCYLGGIFASRRPISDDSLSA